MNSDNSKSTDNINANFTSVISHDSRFLKKSEINTSTSNLSFFSISSSSKSSFFVPLIFYILLENLVKESVKVLTVLSYSYPSTSIGRPVRCFFRSFFIFLTDLMEIGLFLSLQILFVLFFLADFNIISSLIFYFISLLNPSFNSSFLPSSFNKNIIFSPKNLLEDMNIENSEIKSFGFSEQSPDESLNLLFRLRFFFN
jgi:hypothetical protein